MNKEEARAILVRPDYRADCRPFPDGCRNCGQPPTGRFKFYCGAACRDVFERDHFWGTARNFIIWLNEVRDVDVSGTRRVANYPRGWICACCERVSFSSEVNHIAPVNGDRDFFSCANHQDNLEVLCLPCHVMATREQRRRGIIGPDGTCESLRAIDLLRGLSEPVKVRQVALA